MDSPQCVSALEKVFAAHKISPEESILEYMGVLLASAGSSADQAFNAIGEILCDHDLASSPAQAKELCKEYSTILKGGGVSEGKKEAVSEPVSEKKEQAGAAAKKNNKKGVSERTSMPSTEPTATPATNIATATNTSAATATATSPATSSSSTSASTVAATAATTTTTRKKKAGKSTKANNNEGEESVVTIWTEKEKQKPESKEKDYEALLATLVPDPETRSLLVEVISENDAEGLEEALSDVLISCDVVETSQEAAAFYQKLLPHLPTTTTKPATTTTKSNKDTAKKANNNNTSNNSKNNDNNNNNKARTDDESWAPIPVELAEEALFEGQILRAKYHEDGKWYSARLDEIISENAYRVTFVQYGNSEVVKLADLKIEQADILDLQARNTEEKTGRTIADLQPDEEALRAARKKALEEKKSVKKKSEALAKIQARKEAVERDLEAQYLRREKERAKRAIEQRQRAMETYLKATATGASRSNEVRIEDFSLPSLGGGAELIASAALTFTPGRRYGLIGRNGMGKTTLLRHIANYEIPGFPTFLRVVHVEQEVEPSEHTVVESVLSADFERQWLLEEEKRLSSNKAGNDQALQKLFARMQEIDVWGAEARACAILAGLSFTQERMQQRTMDLSGGWRMRVALAQALFVNPDLLLLDEPTNHLDFPAVIWLEDYLCKYKHTLVIVSHDRAFINNVITDTVYLTNRTLLYYKGNYDTFMKTREEQLKQQKKEYEANKEKREHMQAFIDKFRANAKRASLVQSRIKALARMDVVDEVVEDSECVFSLPDPGIISASAVTCLKVAFGYTPDNILLRDVSCNVDLQSRIGVIGANGAGKSTLVKILLGELEPLEGEVKRNSQARIATFSQHHMDQLDLSLDSVENLLALYPKTHPQLIRRHLGSFGITGDLALQKVRTLSGGQKSRVALALITWKKPHILMMDEPTNHLDLETIEALIVALRNFPGGVVLISHDQHFLQSIGTEFWGVTGGTVERFHTFSEARNFTYKSA